jgi:hypothetical protein
MSEVKPILHPVPRGPGGRPNAPEPGTRLSTWVPASYHNQLARVARERDQTVSSLVRQLIILRLT